MKKAVTTKKEKLDEDWQSNGNLNFIGAFGAAVRCIEPVGSVVWTADKNGCCSVRDMNGVVINKIPKDESNPMITSLQSSVIDRVWVGYATGLIRVFDAGSVKKKPLLEEKRHKDQVTTMYEKGKWMFSGSIDFYVSIWNTTTLEWSRAVRYGSGVKSLCSSDSILYCGGYDGSILFWHTDIDGEDACELGRHTESINCITLGKHHPEHLWSAGDDNKVCIWDIDKSSCVHQIKSFNSPAKGLLDLGHIILTSDGRGNLQSFSSNTFEPFRKYQHAKGVILSMSVAAVHLVNRVWTADSDGKVRVFFDELRNDDDTMLEAGDIHRVLEQQSITNNILQPAPKIHKPLTKPVATTEIVKPDPKSEQVLSATTAELQQVKELNLHLEAERQLLRDEIQVKNQFIENSRQEKEREAKDANVDNEKADHRIRKLQKDISKQKDAFRTVRSENEKLQRECQVLSKKAAATTEIHKLRGELSVERNIRQKLESSAVLPDELATLRKRSVALDIASEENKILSQVVAEQKKKLQLQDMQLCDPVVTKMMSQFDSIKHLSDDKDTALALQVQNLEEKCETIRLQEESIHQHRMVAEKHLQLIDQLQQQVAAIPVSEVRTIIEQTDSGELLSLRKESESLRGKLSRREEYIREVTGRLRDRESELRDAVRDLNDAHVEVTESQKHVQRLQEAAVDLTSTPIPLRRSSRIDEYEVRELNNELAASHQRIQLQQQVLREKEGRINLLEKLLSTKETVIDELEVELTKRESQLHEMELHNSGQRNSDRSPQNQHFGERDGDNIYLRKGSEAPIGNSVRGFDEHFASTQQTSAVWTSATNVNSFRNDANPVPGAVTPTSGLPEAASGKARQVGKQIRGGDVPDREDTNQIETFGSNTHTLSSQDNTQGERRDSVPWAPPQPVAEGTMLPGAKAPASGATRSSIASNQNNSTSAPLQRKSIQDFGDDPQVSQRKSEVSTPGNDNVCIKESSVASKRDVTPSDAIDASDLQKGSEAPDVSTGRGNPVGTAAQLRGSSSQQELVGDGKRSSTAADGNKDSDVLFHDNTTRPQASNVDTGKYILSDGNQQVDDEETHRQSGEEMTDQRFGCLTERSETDIRLSGGCKQELVTIPTDLGFDETKIELQTLLRDKDELLKSMKSQLLRLIKENEELTKSNATLKEEKINVQRIEEEAILARESELRKEGFNELTKQGLVDRMIELEEHLNFISEQNAEQAGAKAQLDVIKGVLNELTLRLETREREIHEQKKKTIHSEHQLKNVEIELELSKRQASLYSKSVEDDDNTSEINKVLKLTEQELGLERVERLRLERDVGLHNADIDSVTSRNQLDKNQWELQRVSLCGTIENLSAKLREKESIAAVNNKVIDKDREIMEKSQQEYESELSSTKRELNNLKHDHEIAKGRIEDERRLRIAERERMGYTSSAVSVDMTTLVEEVKERNEQFKKEVNELRIAKSSLLQQIVEMQEEEKKRKFNTSKEVSDFKDIIDSLTEQKKLLANHSEGQEIELGRLMEEINRKERSRQEAVVVSHEKESEILRRSEATNERLQTQIVKQATELSRLQSELARLAQEISVREIEMERLKGVTNDVQKELAVQTRKSSRKINELDSLLYDRDCQLKRLSEEIRMTDPKLRSLEETNALLKRAAAMKNEITSEEDSVIATLQKQLRDQDEEHSLLNQLIRELRLRLQKFEVVSVSRQFPTHSAHQSPTAISEVKYWGPNRGGYSSRIQSAPENISSWHKETTASLSPKENIDITTMLKEYKKQSARNREQDALLKTSSIK